MSGNGPTCLPLAEDAPENWCRSAAAASAAPSASPIPGLGGQRLHHADALVRDPVPVARARTPRNTVTRRTPSASWSTAKGVWTVVNGDPGAHVAAVICC